MQLSRRFICIAATAALLAAAGMARAEPEASPGQALETALPAGLSEQLARTVREAKEMYERQRSIDPELAERLGAAKEELIRTVMERLTVRPDGSLPADSRFWLEAALPWQDERLLGALLEWTKAFPLETYESYAYEQLVADTLREEHKTAALERLGRADRQGTHALLNVMLIKGWLDEKLVDQWLETYYGRPQWDGIVDFLTEQREDGMLMRIYDNYEMKPGQKYSVIAYLSGWPRPEPAVMEWLGRVARTAAEPSIGQMIDQQLVLHRGDKEAAERLYESGRRHGFLEPLNGRVEKLLADMHPSGELAAGIREYEAIRGKPYFYGLDDGWYDPEGSDYAQPEQAIGRWLGFVEKYPLHPAADDAAYRLARCYQLAGDGGNALYWLDRAVGLGDRDLGYDARGMLLFVLDVELPEGANTDRLPSWMKPWLQYSEAVESIRGRRYGEAAEKLGAFIRAYGGTNIFAEAYAVNRADHDGAAFPEDRYPFWERVGEQLRLTERLAQLAEAAEAASQEDKADRQYALAAAIYREPMLYYNHLWRGTRQSFYSYGHLKDMNYYEPMDKYIGRFNHLVQAIGQFDGIDLQTASDKTAAKTLYSTALGYSKLSHFAEEVSFYMPTSRLHEKVAEYAGKLLKRAPESELADDALMLAYYHTKDTSWLENVIRRYPEGDQAPEAVRLLEKVAAEQERQASEMETIPSYEPSYGVRFEKWQPQDGRLPASVRQWAERHRNGPYRGTLAEGDWIYVLLTADEGKVLSYLDIRSERFRMHVSTFESAPADGKQYPRTILARVKAKFVHGGDWTWQTYRE